MHMSYGMSLCCLVIFKVCQLPDLFIPSLHGNEQHEHLSKPLLLYSLNDSKSYRFEPTLG